jgi:hypothetical protein
VDPRLSRRHHSAVGILGLARYSNITSCLTTAWRRHHDGDRVIIEAL